MLTRPSGGEGVHRAVGSASDLKVFRAGGRWLRSHPLAALSVIFIWIAATRIFYIVLHDPMLGYGNQFDMGRTAACLNLWPNLPAGPGDIAYFDAPIEKHRLIKIASQSCYPSAEVLLDQLAITLDGIRRHFAADALVDMRAIGLLKALLLVVAACVAHNALRADPRIALLHATTFMLVMADPVLTLYLNTLYGEFVAAFGAYAAIVGMAAITLNRRWTSSTILLFLSGIASLAFSRLQHVLLPLFFMALLAALTIFGTPPRRWLRDHVATCWVIALLCVMSIASIVINARFMAANPIFYEVNRNNMLFGAVLPATAEPNRVVAALGLPSSCAALAYSDFFRKASRGQSGACPEALAISPFRMLAPFAYEPMAMFTLVGRGILRTSAWRMPYVGEVASAVLERVPPGPLLIAESVDSVSRSMGYVGHVIFWVVPVVNGFIAGLWLLTLSLRTKSDSTPDRHVDRSICAGQVVIFSLSVLITSAWVTSLFGDGYSELTRHVHLGLLAALASWVLLMGSIILQRRLTWSLRAILCAAFVIAAIVGLLTMIPVAFGQLAEPLDDASLSTSAPLSGFVISPRRVVAVEIEQQGRLPIRTSVKPATTYARYHPINRGRNAFDYTFDSATISARLETGIPISVYAISDGHVRELVDVRHWCVTGSPCQ